MSIKTRKILGLTTTFKYTMQGTAASQKDNKVQELTLMT